MGVNRAPVKLAILVVPYMRHEEDDMGLKPHTRTEKGRFREERSDAKAKNLAPTYREFEKVPPNTTLGQVKRRLGTSSMADTRKALRAEQRKR
jgi:hypothetical protein